MGVCAAALRRGMRCAFERQPEPAPDAGQRFGQCFDQLIIMKRRWFDAQTLGTARLNTTTSRSNPKSASSQFAADSTSI